MKLHKIHLDLEVSGFEMEALFVLFLGKTAEEYDGVGNKVFRGTYNGTPFNGEFMRSARAKESEFVAQRVGEKK